MFLQVFVERFSQGLQAEYKDKGIIIQVLWFLLLFLFPSQRVWIKFKREWETNNFEVKIVSICF